MKTFRYSSNNSGGGWWLTDDQWKAREAAGWVVDWRTEKWLGTLATSAMIQAQSEDVAIALFEHATGASFEDEGCECCGRPHNMYEAD